ncbi:alpha-ketoglutarate decarboxylase [Antarcticibacterium flavum]|uniref:Alpha-ketoglutarate decarboxylase n=1 Tax=Antarcticibacterium flavum TaxID=2058175 RepID=A0A5B7X5B7_9FLAO|nr:MULTISPECIES: alpha-ketoglutarate decarboxylase [Antarcticibacterium]MCM4159461.1 alpha-ketoglutarate decarboxylase [Antarcticibacterium sp. W02-3]QCY69902.1 alpha-ketoglutarate decarboxylase [Antarcticibacterium flavum]
MENTSILKKKANYLIIILLITGMLPAFAQMSPGQAENEQTFWNDVRFGGSLGLSFGKGFFTGLLAPSAIYDFNNTFSAGAGLSAAYASQRNFNTNSFGGSLIGMLRPIRGLQLSTEFEQLHITRRYELEGGNRKDTYWVPALFLGIGYNTGPIVTGIRYDVLHSDRSFYRNALMPFVSVYF